VGPTDDVGGGGAGHDRGADRSTRHCQVRFVQIAVNPSKRMTVALGLPEDPSVHGRRVGHALADGRGDCVTKSRR
jgi:hypothetical protein